MRRYRFRNYVISAETTAGLTVFTCRYKGRLCFKWKDILSRVDLLNYDFMTSYFKSQLRDIEFTDTYAIF